MFCFVQGEMEGDELASLGMDLPQLVRRVRTSAQIQL